VELYPAWTITLDGKVVELRKQKLGYRTGKALQSHINSQHKGKFDENCPACRELKEKQDKVHNE